MTTREREVGSDEAAPNEPVRQKPKTDVADSVVINAFEEEPAPRPNRDIQLLVRLPPAEAARVLPFGPEEKKKPVLPTKRVVV